jgi:hypothetical protein
MKYRHTTIKKEESKVNKMKIKLERFTANNLNYFISLGNDGLFFTQMWRMSPYYMSGT